MNLMQLTMAYIVSESCIHLIQEYKERICYYHTWFKEYDRLYFEIWRRVTKGTVSVLCATKQLLNDGSLFSNTLYMLINAWLFP